jgi:hypothetical protein
MACNEQNKGANVYIRLESMKGGNWWTFKALLTTKYLSKCLD